MVMKRAEKQNVVMYQWLEWRRKLNESVREREAKEVRERPGESVMWGEEVDLTCCHSKLCE